MTGKLGTTKVWEKRSCISNCETISRKNKNEKNDAINYGKGWETTHKSR